MANPRVRTPDELKEFIALCRKGRLYDVERWIASGRQFQMPPGNYAMSPLQSALQSGFHSMMEVLLKAGVSQQEKDRALWRAALRGRLDMVELLTEHGADVETITFKELMWTRHGEIIQWFIDNGEFELEEGFPMARALGEKHREFLGVYIKLRDRVPSARHQASVALRTYVREGDLKWVSLMLWAGADPRARVQDLKYLNYGFEPSTALEDAVFYGHVELVRKFKLNPKIDDVDSLLSLCSVNPEEKMLQMLLKAGGNPNYGNGEENVMQRLIGHFAGSVSRDLWCWFPGSAIRCLELAVSYGGRWQPIDESAFYFLRKAIAKAERNTMVRSLNRLINSHVIEQDVFKRLVDTPPMKKFLDSKIMWMVPLRRFAGHNLDSRGRPRVRKSNGIEK
jgi:hypothetical protein